MKEKLLIASIALGILLAPSAAELKFKTNNPIEFHSEINLKGNKITNITNSNSGLGVVTRSYVDNNFLSKTEDNSLQRNLFLNGHNLSGAEYIKTRGSDIRIHDSWQNETLMQFNENGSVTELKNRAAEISSSNNNILRLVQTDAGSTSGTAEAGWNFIEFKDGQNDRQAWIGIDPNTNALEINNQLSSNKVRIESGLEVFSGPLNMRGSKVINVSSPTQPMDAVTLQYADTEYLNKNGGTMQGPLSLNDNNISKVDYIRTLGNDLKVQDTGSGEIIIRFNEGGNVRIPNGNLHVPNNIEGYWDSSCPSGRAIIDIFDNGSMNCMNVTDEVSSAYVNRDGDTMTGNLRMQDNYIIEPGEIRTGGSGSDTIAIRDTNNNQDIARFNEGGETTLPNGDLTSRGGAGAVKLKAKDTSMNHTYAEFYTNIDSINTRSGWIGYGNDNTNTFTINNQMGGGLQLKGGSVSIPNGGLTISGDLSLGNSGITNLGSGNINLGDGNGNIDMNGQKIYDSALSHTDFLAVTDSKSDAETKEDNMGGYSAYIKDNLSVGGDILGSGGGDVAENVKTEQELEPGTVTTISGTKEVEKSAEEYDAGVAGVVSTDPGVTLEQKRDGVPLALSGIVPVKATVENGKIEPGDLMTTSSKDGYAMKCEDSLKCHGSIIGKAMDSLNKTGKVEMLVTLG